MLQQAIINSLEKNEKIENLSKNRNYQYKRQPYGNYRTEKYNEY